MLNVFPGQVFTAKVSAIGSITPEGQLTPTGNVPPAPIGLRRTPYPVYLELNDKEVDLNDLPGGSIGNAAIFTEKAEMSHVIRRVMLRMESWMNYVIP